MNNMITTSSSGNLAPCYGTASSFVGDLLNAIPLALAAPILAYQRTRAQADLIEVLVEAKRQERSEILRTMQVLAKYKQLTPELSQQLMIAYNQQPY